MAERRLHGLERVLGVNALFSTAYGNVGSSIYYALGLVASFALGLTPIVFVITGVFFFCTAATYAEATTMYPEAGGSSSFARRAFNEFWSFFAAWGQMLNYIITVAISAFFVPHYLSVFWPALHHGPGDIIGGIVVGILAATILFIATNAGVIGVSRLTYSMGQHRQLPERLRALHPRFRTPYVAIAVFGLVACLTILPGQADFLGTIYAFGAMLSCTIAHLAVIALRVKHPDAERPWRGPGNLSFRGVDLPMFAVLGGLGTAIAFVVVTVLNIETLAAGGGM